MYGKSMLEHIYEDWMDIEILQSTATYEMMDCLERKYSGQVNPLAALRIDDRFTDEEKEYHRLCAKITACHQKLNMMQYAKKNAIECRCEFETTQNMCFPSLFGVDKTRILFYAESAVLFARNALDVAAPFFSNLLFDSRIDSFNDLSNKILKEPKEEYKDLQQYFNTISVNSTHAFRLLCGITRGRSLRDIIVHQTNIRIGYYEYKEESEKEKLYVIVDKEFFIEFDEFLTSLCDGVEEILLHMISETNKLISC